jgi:hypothetical protein
MRTWPISESLSRNFRTMSGGIFLFFRRTAPPKVQRSCWKARRRRAIKKGKVQSGSFGSRSLIDTPPNGRAHVRISDGPHTGTDPTQVHEHSWQRRMWKIRDIQHCVRFVTEPVGRSDSRVSSSKTRPQVLSGRPNVKRFIYRDLFAKIFNPSVADSYSINH